MQRSRAVVFDIGGVLAVHDWDGVADSWGRRHRVDKAGLLSAIFSGNDDKLLVGRMSEDEWWTVVGERLGANASEVADLIADIEARELWDQPLLDYAHRLRGEATTAILSNAWSSQRVRLRANGVDELFDQVFLSCEVGLAKPDRAIFELVAETIGVPATDTIFVDDVEENIDAATRLGFYGHLFVDAPSAIEAVTSFLAG